MESDVGNDEAGGSSRKSFGEITDCDIADNDVEEAAFPFHLFPFVLRVDSKWISCEESDDSSELKSLVLRKEYGLVWITNFAFFKKCLLIYSAIVTFISTVSLAHDKKVLSRLLI